MIGKTLATCFITLLCAGCASNLPVGTPPVDQNALVSVYDAHGARANGAFFSPNGCVLTVHHFPFFLETNPFTIWDDKRYVGDVLRYNHDWDMTVLKTTGVTPALDIPENTPPPKEGERLYMITRDGGHWLRVLHGSTMALGQSIIADGYGTILLTYHFHSDKDPILPGMSGSFLFRNGEVTPIGYLIAKHPVNEKMGYFIHISGAILSSLFPNIDTLCIK